MWPPRSHQAIFGDSQEHNDEGAQEKSWHTVCVGLGGTTSPKQEVDLQMELFARVRPICNNLEQAVIETLSTVLWSITAISLPGSD